MGIAYLALALDRGDHALGSPVYVRKWHCVFVAVAGRQVAWLSIQEASLALCQATTCEADTFHMTCLVTLALASLLNQQAVLVQMQTNISQEYE